MGYHDASPTRPGFDKPVPPAPESLRVVVVDDHDLVAGTLILALRGRGLEAEIVTHPTPATVVEIARSMAPAMVLLDLDLGPYGSGLDLVGPLRDAGARVVMLTGETDRARLAACVEAGADGLLAKTVPFVELVEAVTRLSAGDSLLSSQLRTELLAELRAHRTSERERLAPFEALTQREQDVLARLVAGDSAEAVAEASFVSLATVRSHIRSILFKLGVNSQLAAVAMARKAGWPDGGEVHSS